MHNYLIMFIIMMISGFLSTMNTWANKISDIRFSINDFYMAFLMSGWMLFFMGIIDKYIPIIIIGLIIITFSFIAIRMQLFVNQKQFLLGMIPHHSMAITMSSRLQKKKNNIPNLLLNIIDTQRKEINFMKNKLK